MTEENLPSELKVGYQRPDRNLALELVRVTEAAPWPPAAGSAAATRTAPTAPRSTRCAR